MCIKLYALDIAHCIKSNVMLSSNVSCSILSRFIHTLLTSSCYI